MKYMYVYQQGRFRGILKDDIILIETKKPYSSIITPSENFLSKWSLNELEVLLEGLHFCRVHAAYIVSLEHVAGFTGEVINLGTREVPVGRRYKEEFLKRVRLL